MAVNGINTSQALLQQTRQVGQNSNAMVSAKDQDGDFALSSSESGFGESLFAAIDSNSDSKADTFELSRAYGPHLQTQRSSQQTAQNESFLAIHDADASGDLSADELDISEEAFAGIDTDSDGLLSSTELHTAYENRVRDQAASRINDQLISVKDSDGDSQLTADELGLDSDIFGTVDTDSDGFASLSELNTALITRLAAYRAQSATATTATATEESGVSVTA